MILYLDSSDLYAIKFYKNKESFVVHVDCQTGNLIIIDKI